MKRIIAAAALALAALGAALICAGGTRILN